MDILTDTLNLAGLKSRLLNQREFSRPMTAKFPCSRSIGFHVVLKGVAYVHAQNRKSAIVLQRGDIALMARGCDHLLSTEEKVISKARSLEEFDSKTKTSASTLTVVSGAYQLWNDPVHPFFTELPEWFVLKNDEVGLDDGLYQMMDLLGREISQDHLGSELVVQGILDVMFSLIVRRVIKLSGAKKRKWSRSMQNTQVRKALEFLHANLQHDWSLEELAKGVGISRSGLAAQFKKHTGDSPLRYLATLRIQKAITLLTTSDLSIEQIGFEVGYKDSFTFSKSFKKIAGLAPRDYRRQYASEADAQFRLS